MNNLVIEDSNLNLYINDYNTNYTLDEFDKESGILDVTTKFNNNNDSRILNRTSSMGSIPVRQQEQNLSINSSKLIQKIRPKATVLNAPQSSLPDSKKKIVINFEEAMGILHNDLLSLEI